MALQLVITNAGRAAVIDQANGGFRAVRIAAVGVSPTAITAAPASANLPDEVKRIATIAGEATATDVTHLTVTDESNASYTVRSFALYLSDGTLFALYGQADPIVQKSAQALLLLSIDVALSNIPAAAITFGNANFINPAATQSRAGVIEIADDDEELAATDRTKALTPKSLDRTIRRGVGGRPIDYDMASGSLTIRGDAFGWETGYFFRGAAGATLGGFGAIGGNNAVSYFYVGTGYQATNNLRIYPSRVSYGDSTIWHAGNDGAGSGLDADLLDGQEGSDYIARRGMVSSATIDAAIVPGFYRLNLDTQSDALFTFDTPTSTGPVQMAFSYQGSFRWRSKVDSAFWTGWRTIWHTENDGAGSGLDADLLDGRNASEFALLSGADFSGPISVRTPNGGISGGIKLVASPASGAAYFQILDWTGNVQWGLFGFGASGLIRWNDNTVWHAGNDGSGSTLDADLVDGWHRDDIRDWNNQLNRPASVWHAGNDGAGSGLDADLLDGLQGSDYVARRGAVNSTTVDSATVPGFYRLDLGPQSDALFTFDTPTSTGPIQMAFSYQGSFRWRSKVDSLSWTGWRSIWHTDNDGAGSGLDADLLDGWQRDDVRDWNNILNRPGTFPATAHTHGAADIAGAFAGSLSGNGYVVLPNGLILQWVTGAQQAASSEGTQYVTFPIAFNTCFQVIVSTQVANANIESHAIYQLISNTTEGATVMRQLVSASGADREASWPHLFAIGR